LFKFLLAQLIGCKYTRSHSVSQIFFQIERKSVEIVGLGGRHKIAANSHICASQSYFIA